MAYWLKRIGESITFTNIVLLLLGCASLVLYRLGLSANGTEEIRWFIKLAFVQSAIYFLAVWLVIRAGSSRSTLLLVIAFAIMFRVGILFSPPNLSDDIYRYVWDGRVQAAGINPYRYVPADPALAHLRDAAIYPEINRRDYARTIYPPVAQFLFFLTTRISESVTWMKLTMVGFELVTAWAIVQLLASFGLSLQRLLIYAWHPLIVWEFAGSGHIDAVSIMFIVLAFLFLRKNSNIAAGCALALATLIKLFPLVLFPALYKRWAWKVPLAFAITIVVAYLPYLSVGPKGVFGFLAGYATEEKLISGEKFYALSLVTKLFGVKLSAAAYAAFVVLIVGAFAIWTIHRNAEREGLKHGMVLATMATVLFAPHYTWYFAWLVPFLCFTPVVAVFYLTASSFLLYGTWLGDSPNDMFKLNSFIYLPFAVIGAVEFIVRRVVCAKPLARRANESDPRRVGIATGL